MVASPVTLASVATIWNAAPTRMTAIIDIMDAMIAETPLLAAIFWPPTWSFCMNLLSKKLPAITNSSPPGYLPSSPFASLKMLSQFPIA